ncbi:MAG TPA: TOMM precursor leader peptide-binding protein [Pseudonocardiaceae bacterium]|nr:TOMM precursor leader peptide-binding protein [Pseudonocardiaceae bacterium]
MSTSVPGIRRHLGVSVVRGEGVYLLCEHGSAVVTDPLAERLFPLLDGKHDLTAITEALDPDVPPDRVRAVVAGLLRSGQVVDVDPDADERTAGYWESLNLHGDEATRQTGVRLTTFGVVPADCAAGLDLSDTGGLDVVLTDDYLRPELAAFDQARRAAGRPWLLAKPVGVICYVGPVFVPDGACYHCLEIRLRGQRRAEDYLESRLPGTRVAPPTVDIPPTRQLAAGAVATAAAHWLAGHRHAGTHAVLTIDTASLRTETHPVTRRPQCPTCGDADLVAATMNRPLVIASRRKASATDGGHRSRSPEDMMATWGGLVDPITGVVPELKPIATGLPFVRGYSSGYNRAYRVTSLQGLRDGLRTHSCGKGVTDIQARASALGEALERYSGVYAGDEPTITASYAELNADAVHPNASMLFSDTQFEQRAEWNARRIMFQAVADPLDERAALDWTPMWSLTQQRTRYVPTSLLFYGYPNRGPAYAIADSNGCAAGTSIEDAALQGFYELVERDAVAIWWYNRLRRRAFDLDSLNEPWVATVRAEYARLGRELWALDLTSDFGIPAIVAVSRRVDKPSEDIIFGFGAHHDAHVAGLRAVSELNQFLPFVAFTKPDGTGYRAADPTQRDWWAGARAADHPYLLPDPNLPAVSAADLTLPTSDDLADDLLACQELVRAKGMDLLAIDMTRPDIGLPVVKVMVPGMRHFWTRYAPGRLFDVPVQQGWLPVATAEDQLNPTAMFV